MKALVWREKDKLVLEEKPIPEINEDEVLLKVAYSGICASDVHIIKGEVAAFEPPQILGHEFSGTIAKVGSKVTEYQVGQAVTAHPWVGCGECYFCKRAQENFCLNPFCTLFEERSGAFAEYLVVKAKQVYELPEGMDLKTAAIIEPFSIGIHCVDLANIKPGYTVAVLGAGIIGIACMQVALRAGAGLMILSDLDDHRLDIGRKCGADIVVNPGRQDLKQAVMDATDGLGVDTCIEAVGIKPTLDAAIPITKNAGTVLVGGVAPTNLTWEVSPQEINMRELCIQGSMWSPYSFIRTIALMNKFNTKDLELPTFSLDEYEQAFDAQKNRQGSKILFAPWGDV